MAESCQNGIKLDVGSSVRLQLRLQPAQTHETVTVTAETPVVESSPVAVSDVIDQRALEDLPLNGRRYTDLALLNSGVTEDPRGLTSASAGDLAFGGVRGYNSSFLVDGSDDNNGFFAQARGRYRAPYQFSNEVIQEFRVSSNTYGAELGRSAGAVVNVVTKSGGNHTHGSVFYYLRDGSLSATHPFLSKKYPDEQHQFGFSLGGPLRRDRAIYFIGVDQHNFHVPSVVQFMDGSTKLTPTPADYEFNDKDLVFRTAAELSQLAGTFRSELLGNAAFAKADLSLTPHHFLSLRLNLSRYYGSNNVFFDPSSPITHFAESENGEEQVSTETVQASLTSALAYRVNNLLRAQFSRDLQESVANSSEVQSKIDNILSGFGRSSILPRRTNEHRFHLSDTLSVTTPRHALKFGGDLLLTRIENYFPRFFGGEYLFEPIRVNPFTFQPETFGLHITPLRAFAHQVPRYYIQDFGKATSHPDADDYSWFAQDTLRLGDHLALSLGLRYDLQTLSDKGMVTNPLWPDSGKVPHDHNNFSPRLGFAASFGDNRPLVLRGGFGIFYTRIPQIYNSAVEMENGIDNQHLFLDQTDFVAKQVFPAYPGPLVSCKPGAQSCTAPDNVSGFLTSVVSAFDPKFQIPYVEQASLSLEKEVAHRTAIGASYLFVAGKHLIRARDVNLPPPTEFQYPVFDENDQFTGDFYTVDSFAGWRFTRSLTCPFPPCIDPLQRPISGVGEIREFESSAASVYHSLTISAKRRVGSGLYFRLGYTWAHAIDTLQDALVAGSPSQVENSFQPSVSARSVTDQRQRFVLAWSYDPHWVHREHPVLKRLFNDWRISSIATAGSGRPIDAKISGDANRDGNSDNDRLPGAPRNGFNGPDYFTTNLRLSRRFQLSDRLRLEANAEFYNVFNRANKRVDITDDGLISGAADFVPLDRQIKSQFFPGYFQKSSTFLQPNNAYSPRQVQFSVRLRF
jgi:hypothetical protein